MTTSEKKIALEKILFEHKDRFMRVSQFRDLLMAFHEFKDLDKAQLRRWIYSHFLTMMKKGSLEKQLVPGTKKWKYRLVVEENNHSEMSCNNGNTRSDLDETLSELEDQLIDKQRESRIYLSELNAYKRMQESYPVLSKYAQTKYLSTFEESYDLLGQIKAIEETLSDHGRGNR